MENENYSEFEDSEGSDEILDTRNILTILDKLPLCEYFIETRKRAKKRAALSWLETCDDDTIKLIAQYSQKVTNQEECPAENKSQDIFDRQKGNLNNSNSFKDNIIKDFCEDCDSCSKASSSEFQQFDDDDECDEEDDMYFLTCLLLAWEHNKFNVPTDSIEESFVTLGMYSNIEGLRRTGLISVKGSGTLLSKDTLFKLTKEGKKTGKFIMSAIQGEIKESKISKEPKESKESKEPNKKQIRKSSKK